MRGAVEDRYVCKRQLRGRVLNFFSCDHRPTGINSERPSGVRNRKNYGKNQTRKARRLPGPRRMQTNRIRRQTKQRRKIRRAGVLHSGASPPILELRRFLYLYLLLTSDQVGSSQNPAHKGSLLSEEQEEAANGRQNDFHHLLSTVQFP